MRGTNSQPWVSSRMRLCHTSELAHPIPGETQSLWLPAPGKFPHSFFLKAFLCWKNSLQECNYSGKQVFPGFPHTPSLLSFAPACSGSCRSVSNNIFPAYVTLCKRRNYQTSSRTAPRECSLRALIRTGSKFCSHSGWEHFFQLKSTCPMDQTGRGSIQSFPFFMDTTRKTKERRDKKRRKHTEKPGLTDLIMSMAQKKAEDEIYSHKTRISSLQPGMGATGGAVAQ